MRLNSITHRRLSVAIVLFSWGSVGVALFTQHVLGMQPCPWCIAQRVLYLLCGALAMLAALAPVRSSAGRVIATLFSATGIVAAGGALVTALYQHFVMNTGLADWLPEVFEPRASCAEADQALIGLPYSIWSAILAVILLVLGGQALRPLWRSRVR